MVVTSVYDPVAVTWIIVIMGAIIIAIKDKMVSYIWDSPGS